MDCVGALWLVTLYFAACLNSLKCTNLSMSVCGGRVRVCVMCLAVCMFGETHPVLSFYLCAVCAALCIRGLHWDWHAAGAGGFNLWEGASGQKKQN